MTNGTFTKDGRALLTEGLQQAVPTAAPETVQAFVDLLGDVVEGRKTPIEMRDALSWPSDLQSLFQNLSHKGSVPNPAGGAPLLDLHGQINFGSQIVQDLVAGIQVKIIVNNADGSTEVSSSDPPRRIIYISHCALDDEAKALLDTIDAKLREEGFVVWKNEARLVDHNWRDELFDQIGRCQGAVLLLSRDALESEVVASELVVLLNRLNIMKSRFVLRRVATSEVSAAALAHSRLNDILWAEVAVQTGDTPLAVAERLAADFATALPADLEPPAGPRTTLESTIATVLTALDRNALTQTLITVKVEVPAALSMSERRAKLVQATLKSDITTAKNLLRRLDGTRMVKEEDIGWLFLLITASWVNPRLAAWLALAALQPKQKRALGLNVTSSDMAQLCARRACCDLFPDHLGKKWYEWLAVTATKLDNYTDPAAQIAALTEDLEAQLRQKRIMDPDPQVKDPDTALKDALQDMEANDQKLFVLIPTAHPNGPLDPNTLALMQNAYPTVIFLLGFSPPSPSPTAWSFRQVPIVQLQQADGPQGGVPNSQEVYRVPIALPALENENVFLEAYRDIKKPYGRSIPS